MTKRLIILIVLLCASPALAQQTAKAQGQITVVNGNPPPPPQGLGWTDIIGQKQSNVCPPNPGTPGSCNGVVDAWSGGWADTTRNQLCWWGGGHTDYSGNEVYCFSLATKTVSRMDNPSVPTMCVTTNTDNTPSSRHNYGSLVYVPVSDRVFEFGGGGWCNAGFASSDTWTLNPAQLGSGAPNGWLARDPTANPGSTHPDGSLNNMQAAYDPNTQLVFVNDNVGGSGLWEYNVGTNFYTHLNSQPANLQLHTRIVIDPNRKLIVRFGDGQVSTIDISSGSSFNAVTKTGTGCTALINANNPGLAYDPVLNVITGWPNFGPTVYFYNATTDSCTSQTFTANAPPDSSHTGSPSTTNGTFGRFGYFPAFNMYVLVNEWSIDVHTLVVTNADTDWAARCASPGVVRCVQLATSADLAGNAAPGKPRTTSGLTTPSIDNTVFHSGGGSLRFAIPAGATQANTSGSWNIDFTDNFSTQFDSLINGDPLSPTTGCGGVPCTNEFWISWVQRFDSGMLQHFANGNGWKQAIIGEGDQPGFTIFSCTVIELPVENSNQLGIPRMYNSCGYKLNAFDPLTTPTGNTDSHGNGIFSPENQAGGYLQCTYAASINIPTAQCFFYPVNTWVYFLYHVKIGTWFPAGSPPNPSRPFVHDSQVELYAGVAGTTPQLIIGYEPGATSPACDNQQVDIPACLTGYDLTNTTAFGFPDQDGNAIHAKYGQIWFLPYDTNLNCPACTAANTWYQEFLVSKQRPPDPKF